jgi:hypothetical protein
MTEDTIPGLGDAGPETAALLKAAPRGVRRYDIGEEVRLAFARTAFERCEIADAQVEPGSAVPMDTLKDPYWLDFLGLRGTYQESDLEEAILRDAKERLVHRSLSAAGQLDQNEGEEWL